MPTWPATLPQLMNAGTTDQDVDAVQRNAMDAGPPTRRNRFSGTIRHIDTPMVLTAMQRATFDTFYRTTLYNGSLAFDWVDPVGGATISVAFRAPAQWQLIRHGSGSVVKYWAGTIQLEVQP